MGWNWRTGAIPAGEVPTLWGRPVEQVMTALCAFDRLFAQFRPARIVELGTGSGGFSVYLAVWARILQAELLTVDIKANARLRQFLASVHGLPVRFRHCDYYLDIDLAGRAWTIPKCSTLWLCDGGTEKGRQLRFVAPNLRVGDVLMAHDYKPPTDTTEIVGQVDADAVGFVCREYGYEPFMQDMFDAFQSHWLCLRKAQ